MPPDYSQGKIYSIKGASKSYIGSTTQPLSIRLSEHRSHFKQWKAGTVGYCASFEVVKDPSSKIELLEIFPCKTKQELRRREQYYINKMKSTTNKYATMRV